VRGVACGFPTSSHHREGACSDDDEAVP
jgi:hypothetical protein